MYKLSDGFALFSYSSCRDVAHSPAPAKPLSRMISLHAPRGRRTHIGADGITRVPLRTLSFGARAARLGGGEQMLAPLLLELRLLLQAEHALQLDAQLQLGNLVARDR